MSLLRRALENDGFQAVEVNPIPQDLELAENSRNIDLLDQEQSECISALESLIETKYNLENGISYSIESINFSSSDRRIALEGIVDRIRNFFDSVLQDSVLAFKHWYTVVDEFFRSLTSNMRIWEEELNNAENEYNEKNHKFRAGEHHISLEQLWYFFSTADGFSKDPVSDLLFDSEASSFILSKYTKDCVSELSKLSAIVGSAKIKNKKDLDNFVDKVTKLKSADELYISKYVGDGILFNTTSVIRVNGANKRAIESSDKYVTLSELATNNYYREKKSLKHTFYKVAGGGTSIGAMVAFANTPSIKFNTSDIQSVIRSGRKYISNLNDYLDNKKAIQQVSNNLVRDIEKLSKQIDDFAEGNSVAVVKQILDYIGNLQRAVMSPSKEESIRSLKGAKYCGYLAKRMIYNASEYF